MRTIFSKRLAQLLVVMACLSNLSGQESTASAPESLSSLRARAEKGDAEAQELLGVGYSFGRYGPKNEAIGAKWLRMCADQGRASCQSLLAGWYEDGTGVPQDSAEALRLHRKSAEQGNFSSMTHLAYLYHDGEKVPQDYGEALRWARAAAEFRFGGDLRQSQPKVYAMVQELVSEAEVLLSMMYYNGEGVPQDYVAAHMWVNLAASNSTGEKQKAAMQFRDATAELMTPAQIAEAQRLAREWTTKHAAAR